MIVSRPSALSHVTTLDCKPVASMVVAPAPSELCRYTALPTRSVASLYVPGATTISSPSTAASMATWMEQKGSSSVPVPACGHASSSTCHVVCADAAPDAMPTTSANAATARRNGYDRTARFVLTRSLVPAHLLANGAAKGKNGGATRRRNGPIDRQRRLCIDSPLLRADAAYSPRPTRKNTRAISPSYRIRAPNQSPTAENAEKVPGGSSV